VTVFKQSDGPLVPPNVKQVYLSDSTWDIGKNHFGEVAVLGDVKVTLPLVNDLVRVNPPPQAAERNARLRKLADERDAEWRKYLAEARSQTDEIWGVLVADALRQSIEQHRLHKQFVYVNEVFADTAPFTFLLPLGTDAAAPVSYYDVGCGGPLGYGLASALGIRLEARGRQGIEPRLVVAVSGDGSTLFYPQGYWTAANHEIDVLHIILNNREYHSLQLGLQAVVAAYGTEPGFNFQPNDADPDYLRIARPDVDFVGLAKAFGMLSGETVRKPGDVHEAVNRGVEHVLETRRSYVLDVRTDQATPASPPLTSERSAAPMPARYAKQPPLDVFHRGAAPQADAVYGIPPNGRIIF
jgi:benzoylformate decarboxylase